MHGTFQLRVALLGSFATVSLMLRAPFDLKDFKKNKLPTKSGGPRLEAKLPRKALPTSLAPLPVGKQAKGPPSSSAQVSLKKPVAKVETSGGFWKDLKSTAGTKS